MIGARIAATAPALAAALALLSAGCGNSAGQGGAGGGGGTGAGGSGGLGPARPGEIATIAGTGERATQSSDEDADGVPDPPIAHDRARFDSPIDMTVDASGSVWILDWNGHKVRRLSQDGMVEFVVGTGIEGDACEKPRSDGSCPLLAAELNHMTDVVLDATGRLVIAAWHNAKIKVADLASDALRDTCGSGTRRFMGDGGPCVDTAGMPLVAFDLPSSLAYDAHGNLFIADQANQVVRRLGGDGVIKTVAGNCPVGVFGCPMGQGYSGDGGMATAAHLRNNLGQGADPQGKIAIDGAGNLYIADTGNHVVRKVVPGADGVLGSGPPEEELITTFAGIGTAGYGGDDGPAAAAKLNEPHDVAVGPDGSVFIADTGNNCVRRVAPDGIISTAAGQCASMGAFGGDGGPAVQARLYRPYGVAVDRHGNLFIADTSNNRVRQVNAN